MHWFSYQNVDTGEIVIVGHDMDIDAPDPRVVLRLEMAGDAAEGSDALGLANRLVYALNTSQLI
jgi:hypothetical protein